MRHSQASAGDFQTPDDSRWLTAFGRELATRAARQLRSALEVERIVCSPLVRCVQTAELVSGCLGLEGEITTLPALRPEGAPQEAVNALEAIGVNNLLAVTHMPIVASMAELLSGQVPGKGASFAPAEVQAFSGGKKTFSWRA